MRIGITLALFFVNALLAQAPGQTQGASPAQGTAADPNAKPPEKCVVSGTAVNAVTGEPLKKTHIALQGSTQDNVGVSASALTGVDGTFVLKDVDAGTYRLMGERTGFATAWYGAKKLSNLGTEMKLTPGQAMTDIVLRLPPQGVVNGRITDSDGEPVANVSVSLTRSMYRNGQKVMSDMSSAMTNDLGEYRIFGVPAGKYKARAQLRGSMGFGDGNDPEEFAPTYYPGQADPVSAATLVIQPGETLRGVDMVAQRTPTRRVRGNVVLSSSHADFVQVMVTSRQSGDFYLPRRNTVVRPPKTAFQFRLPPGSYNVTASFNDAGQMFTGITALEVGDTDVDSVAVYLQPGGEVAGRLRIEGANDLTALAQSAVRVNLYPKENTFMMGVQAGRVGDDGSFTLKNVGPQPMNVNVNGLPSGYYVKAINYGQQDAKASGLTYTGSNDVVEVVVSPNGANVEGVVRNHAGDPVAGATVVLAPAPEERSDSRRFRVARSDQTGHFSLKGLEPNDYTVFAWEDIENGEYMDPDVLKAAENRGKALKLKESAQESLDIECIPAEDAPAATGF